MAAATQDALSSLSKAQKAALIFLLLEEKGAASLFDHMTDDEIKAIGATLLGMQEIPVTDMSSLINEFYVEMGLKDPDHFSGKKIFQKLVDKTLPSDRKGKILKLEDIKGGKGSKFNPLENLFNEITPEQVFRMVKQEHSQVIAVVLTLVKPALSKKVLSQFDDAKQGELLYRISLLSSVPEDMVKLIARNYREKMETGATTAVAEDEKRTMDVPGTDMVLKYLKTQDWKKAEDIISNIEKENPTVAGILRKKFFTLEDMLRADNNGIRALLKSIESATLSIALKGQAEKVQDKFFQNMSTRAATILKEDMEVMPEQKPEDVEVASDKILTEAKRLITEGQMILEALSDK